MNSLSDSAPKRSLVAHSGPGTAIPSGFGCSACHWYCPVGTNPDGLVPQEFVTFACVRFLDHECADYPPIPHQRTMANAA